MSQTNSQVKKQYIKGANHWIKTQKFAIKIDEQDIRDQKKKLSLLQRHLKLLKEEVAMKKKTLRDFQKELKAYVTN